MHQRGDKGVKCAAATGGKVAWRAGCVAVPLAPAFMIAIGSGNPAGGMAERVDDRTWLVLGNQVKPRIQIRPVVYASGRVKIRPVGFRVPQAHRPRLRGRSNPRAVCATVGANDAFKTPICRLYGMTTHGQGRVLRVGPKTGSKHTHQAQRSKRDQSPQLNPHVANGEASGAQTPWPADQEYRRGIEARIQHRSTSLESEKHRSTLRLFWPDRCCHISITLIEGF